MKVLVYQLHGTQDLNKVDIPGGFEDRLQQAVDVLNATHKPLKIKDLNLRWDEVKGIMDSTEYTNLQTLFDKPKGDGYASFLELGKALREKKSLERWRKHVG